MNLEILIDGHLRQVPVDLLPTEIVQAAEAVEMWRKARAEAGTVWEAASKARNRTEKWSVEAEKRREHATKEWERTVREWEDAERNFHTACVKYKEELKILHKQDR